MARDPAIHQHIAGTGVEPADLAIGMQDADIADAADIHHHPRLPRSSELRVMKGRHQRRPLATGGHVAVAKIGDHVDAAQLGQQRRVQALARVAKFGAMSDRLAMRSNRLQRSGFWQQWQQLRHACGVAGGNLVGGERFARDFVGARRLQRHQVGAQRGAEREERSAEGADRAIIGELGQHAIDPVQAGAGHQADVERRSGGHGFLVCLRERAQHGTTPSAACRGRMYACHGKRRKASALRHACCCSAS